jgi:signal transduction histidine kinase
VKYNEEKGFVGVTLAQDDENNGEIRLDVVNTGPGVSGEVGDKIFERFFREDAARSREIDGIGLGLNISSEIIRLHGGTLRLEEATNTITRFVVRMPNRQS